MGSDPPANWMRFGPFPTVEELVRTYPRWEHRLLTDEIDDDHIRIQAVDDAGHPVFEVVEIIDTWRTPDGWLGVTYRPIYPPERATTGPTGWIAASSLVVGFLPVPNGRTINGVRACSST